MNWTLHVRLLQSPEVDASSSAADRTLRAIRRVRLLAPLLRGRFPSRARKRAPTRPVMRAFATKAAKTYARRAR